MARSKKSLLARSGGSTFRRTRRGTGFRTASAETVNSPRLLKAALGRRGLQHRKTAHRRSFGLTVPATSRPSPTTALRQSNTTELRPASEPLGLRHRRHGTSSGLSSKASSTPHHADFGLSTSSCANRAGGRRCCGWPRRISSRSAKDRRSLFARGDCLSPRNS